MVRFNGTFYYERNNTPVSKGRVTRCSGDEEIRAAYLVMVAVISYERLIRYPSA